MSVGVITGIVTSNSEVLLLGRILGAAGAPVTPQSIASIAWQVTDLLAGTIASSGTFAVASSITGLTTNDPRWTADGVGYNFAGQLPASAFPPTAPSGVPLTPAAARAYQIDVKFTGTDGSQGMASYRIDAWPVYF